MSPSSHVCPDCGGALPANAVGGLCPRCIARAAALEGTIFGDEVDSTVPEAQPLSTKNRDLIIERELARGGMGVVYEAQEPGIGRSVVVKFLRSERESDATAVERFLMEGRITGQLEHPGIVPIYHLGASADGRPFYAMRHIRGESLAAVLTRLRDEDSETAARYPLGALLNIFQKICDAVAYAHSRGVIHRDLKPDNVMIGSFGEVVVMDWGLAKTLSGSTEETAMPSTLADTEPRPSTDFAGTMDNTIMGTLGFMAPEQAGGQSNQADERTDVYALGAILYTILTLRPPIRGKDANLMLDRTRSGDIRPPTDYNPGAKKEVTPIPLPHCPNQRIPSVLSAVAMKALAVDPADRYQSVAELQQDIAAYQSGFATSAEQAGWLKQATLLVRRHKTIAAAAAVVLVLTCAFMAKIISNERRARATLANLRASAPLYFEAARALLEEQKLEAALEKIFFATSIEPNDARYHNLQGNILQALQRLEAARDAYALALKCDPRLSVAKENRDLCSALLRQSTNGVLGNDALWNLHEAVRRQGRTAEALFLSLLLKNDRQRLFDDWKARLITAGIPAEGRFTFTDTEVRLDLDKLSIGDLTPLKGIPLTWLRISETKVADLSPLKGMPLKTILLALTPVHDLSPLKGDHLREIQMGFTRVRDLSPLAGTKLRTLVANNNAISDLNPLRGVPLEELNIGSTKVIDVSPLRDVKSLRHLDLSSSPVSDIGPLQGTSLQWLSLDSTRVADLDSLRGMPLTHLQMGGTRVTNLSPLKGLPLTFLTLPQTKVSDSSPLKGMALTYCELQSTLVADVSPLAGMPLNWLSLSLTRVTDLRPLAGTTVDGMLSLDYCEITDLASLKGINASGLSLCHTRISDLGPLRGMPFKTLLLEGCVNIRDLTPLTECRELEVLTVPVTATNIEMLRQLPNLKRLGHTRPQNDWQRIPTAAEFWKAYDARKTSRQ